MYSFDRRRHVAREKSLRLYCNKWINQHEISGGGGNKQQITVFMVETGEKLCLSIILNETHFCKKDFHLSEKTRKSIRLEIRTLFYNNRVNTIIPV